jgi:hypothetical protein
MIYSKTHVALLDKLNNQGVLSQPEDFLGPNWKDVLNFWFYLDTLSLEQLEIADKHYLNMGNIVYFSAIHVATCYSSITLDASLAQDISHCAYTTYGPVAATSTHELIGSHFLLENGISLEFTPLLLNL